MLMGKAVSEFHVLAVDDSLLDRKMIERLLKTSSFQVTTVDSGSKALEFLGFRQDENSRSSPDPPLDSSNSSNQVVEVNLVITDYCMPGMTGYDLLKKIKESSSLRNIPVVIMSSENVPSRISRCLEEGAEEFFLKPVRRSDLNRLTPHLMKTKLKHQEHDSVTEDEEDEGPQPPRDLTTEEIESQTQQQQQQPHRQLSSNNNAKRKSMDETHSPEGTRQRFADLAAHPV
ncbi:hypothetical protein MLD38_020124 [Melastoma candidum]|uniref:Uncharacterized protein n=1 Tax=Melastoma candidum TaxID=119954 RepID=A0ACB9QCC2_9MYRT|nr:hypothetical protein MLD38_020124 [Melastoma candidum]